MLNLNEAFMIGNVMNADIVAEHQASLWYYVLWPS